ncbi:sulfotransferase-like domain-containing protein [Mangrovihabitans endophyticus]|uniref:Branched chain amino acid aminotransferase n=1 Tax=Mangrovihabitans endophyticus TaxID=1751298 RepID=A0A8J3BXW8_9ACTN|nr:sulfotransferase family protein [Mangrovihabitans endophyticus]GGK90791.1 branched chain amino acid aminotransferase [Mangrovihabitans endophyticus]
MANNRIIALWAAPRSRSTAFFRSMVERDDLLALHEPFRNMQDYGHTDVHGRTVRSTPDLIAAIRDLATDHTVFFKDTTDRRHPQVLDDDDLLKEMAHTFLIRRPDEIAASFYAREPGMIAEDVGLENLHEMHATVAALGAAPVVIDSQDLVANPTAMVSAYCAAVGLPFDERTLTWQPGARQEWVQTTGWHDEVARTSGFSQESSAYEQTTLNNEKLAAFAAHHEPFYRELHALRLVPARTRTLNG